jgi:hypothetical protein
MVPCDVPCSAQSFRKDFHGGPRGKSLGQSLGGQEQADFIVLTEQHDPVHPASGGQARDAFNAGVRPLQLGEPGQIIASFDDPRCVVDERLALMYRSLSRVRVSSGTDDRCKRTSSLLSFAPAGSS